MPLDSIGLALSDMMLGHIADLIAIPNQWKGKEAKYLQQIQRELLHFKKLWEITEVDNFSLSHELRTPFGAIMGYREMIEYILVPPIKEEITEYLAYLAMASRIMLCKINETIDR